MKGVIFTTFNEMVEEKFGLDTWTTLLENVEPPSKGIYTSGGTYQDSEMISYVGELSSLTKIEPSQLIEEFGVYLFPALAKKHPTFLQENVIFFDFMKSIHNVIHVEVNKLYPEANLPTMEYESPSPDQLIIFYRSPRKMCALAVGLTKGAACHFNVSINIEHPICMHEGSDHCRLEIKIAG